MGKSRKNPEKLWEKKMVSEKTKDLFEIGIIFIIVVICIVIIRYLISRNFLISTHSQLNYFLEQEQLALEAGKKLLDSLPPQDIKLKNSLTKIIQQHQTNIQTLSKLHVK